MTALFNGDEADKPDVKLFSFPNTGRPENHRHSVEKSSWANLADAMQVIPSPVRTPVEPVYQPARIDQLEDVSSIPDSGVALDENIIVDEQDELDEAPSEQNDLADVQKVLDETFAKGLEQGRLEGREALLQELREQAWQEGFGQGQIAGQAQGMEQGLQEAQVEVTRRADALTDLYHQLQQQRRILDPQQVEQAAILLERLMLEILRVELKHTPEQIANLVEESIRLLDTTANETLKVRLHPMDTHWLQSLIDSERYPLRLLEDDKMTPGGCLIEGELGDVDATLETRLHEGLDHLRTLLLDDPEQMPAADVSVITDDLKHQSMAAPIPEPVTKPVVAPRRAEVVSQTESDVASFTFNPGAVSDAALGAWDALGQ